MAEQKNAPGVAGTTTRGENTTHPTEEKTMNTQNNPSLTDDATMLAEWKERSRAERDAWLAEHPELQTATSWHKTIDVDDLGDSVDVWFERDYGALRLMQRASYRDGALTFEDGTAPSVLIEHDYVEDLTVAQMRELAAALMAAIPTVEAAGVTA